MKNKLYIASAIILCISFIFCACSNNKTDGKSTTVTSISEQTEPMTQTVTYVDESGYHVISRIDFPTQERTHPPVPSRTNSPTYKEETLQQTQAATRAPVTLTPNTTQIYLPNQTSVDNNNQVAVPEKSNGLSVQFKSDPVQRGNDATIAINAQAGKEYTIEVYKNDSDLLVSEKLRPQIANSLGVVTWTFDTDSCNNGYRKIIIKELNSDKYIQTSITII